MIPIDLSVLFSNLVGLFLLIGVGFFAVRARLLPAESSKPMSTLLMKVTVPATIIHSMLRPFDPGFLRLGISIFLVGAVAFPLFSLLSLGLSRLLRVPQDRRGMWCCCATFCNNGFMGFPVALAVLGEEAALCRIGQPREVAEAICFLASERASFITGQVLSVDGGVIV